MLAECELRYLCWSKLTINVSYLPSCLSFTFKELIDWPLIWPADKLLVLCLVVDTLRNVNNYFLVLIDIHCYVLISVYFFRRIYLRITIIVDTIFYSTDACWLDFVGLYLIVFDAFSLICHCKSVIDAFSNLLFIVWHW